MVYLSDRGNEEEELQKLKPSSIEAFGLITAGDEGDEKRGICKRSRHESKKLWEIAAPAILTAIAQFSIEFTTAAFVGHVGELELAAVSLFHNVLDAFVFGIMLGLGSALATVCGQAVGAGEYEMLGVYTQRSCIITLVTAFALVPVYVFASPLLKFLGQSSEISDLAGYYTLWVIPQIFAYALNFPLQKFLQAQSKIWVMTTISIISLSFHVFLNWILVTKLGYGLVGAAISSNISWWIIVLSQIAYVISGRFSESWTGFSLLAFKSVSSFLKLSLTSAAMLCLELWYSTIVILMVGWLKYPVIAVDALSICMKLELWTLMVTLGLNAAISVRVSNELGAGNPQAAKLSIFVTVATSMLLGFGFSASIVAAKDNFPKIFSNKPNVIKKTSSLGYFLAATILVNSIQPVLHGVAVGAGWQHQVAVVNTLCYYIFGLPLAALLCYKFNLGLKGILSGILAGSILQTAVLAVITLRTNWRKEAFQAQERVRNHAVSSLSGNTANGIEMIEPCTSA